MTYARNQALGAHGENVAAAHLVEQGLEVLDRNWRCDLGEIDIVARDGSTLVICEVKTRTTFVHGGPFEAITGHKALRLRRLAHRWLTEHDIEPPSLRIDAISVVVPRRGPAEVARVTGVA